jgi:hypothetical protein
VTTRGGRTRAVAGAVETWFRDQTRDPGAVMRLYARPGEVRISASPPGPGWRLAMARAMAPGWTFSTAFARVMEKTNQWKVAPNA